MLGYGFLLQNAFDMSAPLAGLGLGVSVSVEDSGDWVADAIFDPAARDPDLKPQAAKVVKEIFHVPQSAAGAYKWQPFDRPRQIRLVTISKQDDVDDLKSLSLSASPKQYEYNVLSTSLPRRSFKTTIQSVELDSPTRPSYVAISYTWLDFPREIPLTITIPDTQDGAETQATLPINASLYAFLQRLLSDPKYPSVTLWCDQICIDQTDEAEKSQQVRLMKDIFTNAEKTIIWLGEGDEDSEIALQTLGQTCDMTLSSNAAVDYPTMKSRASLFIVKSELREASSDSSRRRKAIGRLLNRPYFERAWIYQEAAVSHNAIVKIGSANLDFSKFTRAVRAYCDMEGEVQRNFGTALSRSTKGMSALRNIEIGRIRLEKSEITNLQFLSLLCRLAGTVKAKDDKDLVFAFLGFQDQTRKAPLLVPEYQSSTVVVYQRIMRALMRDTKTLDALGIAGIDGDGRMEGLASWIPDWRLHLPQGQPFVMPGVESGFNAANKMVYRMPWEKTVHAAAAEAEQEHDAILEVYGKEIDQVTLVHGLHFDIDSRNKGSIDAFLKLDARSEIIKTLPGPQTSNDDIRKRLLRVLLADGAFTFDDPSSIRSNSKKRIPGSPYTEADMSEFLDVYKSEPSIRKDDRFLGDRLDTLKERRAEMRDAMLIGVQKRLFATQKGRLGLAPMGLQVGDVVVILHGSRVPVVLRQREGKGERWEVVGQCYLEGAMGGEVVGWMEDGCDIFELC